LNNIRESIIKELLPFVTKPGRFIGNEIGSVRRSWEGRVRVALAFPDLYDLGMSNLGLSILYHIINTSEIGHAERVFAVSDDTADRMREKQIPLFSLESKEPLKEFDIVGFNSATELNYTNILSMIDLAGIPLLAKDRADSDPLVAIGGGCAFNPEPLAQFADFFFLGDAEEGILKILEVLKSGSDKPREEKLRALAQIQGVYVPSFYRDQYAEDGKFRSLTPTEESIPHKIKARVVRELKNSYYPATPMLPAVETVHDRLAVEIMRGCGHACRFCQATVIYKPARKRSVDDIVSQVTTSLEKSGYDEVTLLSLSSGDYPEIELLVRRLVDKLKDRHVAVSLPSLRISGLSLELAKLITENKRTGLTFAPEAGTERLRQVMNKPVDEDTLVEVLTEAFKQGWQTIKLYFMVGLPTETEEDLRGIADLITRLNRISEKYRGRRSFNITISPFSPKAHTPWQWEKQIGIEETYQKIDFLKRTIRKRNVHLKFHDPRTTWLEGLLGRGDRRIGDVILRAYRMGAHMDGWSENFDFETWQEACREERIDPDRYLAERSTGSPLPWDHIEKGLSKESLLKELAKSRGLTDLVKSLDKEEKPEKEPPERKRKDDNERIMYGRAPKVQKAQAAGIVPQSRLRIKWGRSGLSRFLSHLDNMKAMERALRRANLPISFSHGFRPKPKISYGPPLSLGFTSEAEYFDIQLDVPVHDYMLGRLSREFPPDFSLLGTKPLLGKTQSLASQLNLAVYEVYLPMDIEKARQKCAEILEAEELHFQRETKSGPVEVEGRKAIIDLACEKSDDGKTRLTMKTGMADLGFIKPLELLEHGFEISSEVLPALEIHRKALYRLENGNLIDPFDLI